MNILYVEDNPLDADLTRNTLHRLAPGLHLDVATSLHGALEHLQSAPDRYDLILADVRLPDGDGLELLAIVRQRGLSLPFVIVTGSGNEELVFRALKAGADDYIVKRGDYLAHLPHVLSDIVRRYRNRLLRHTRPLRVLYAEHRATDIDLTSRFLARYAPHIRLQIARNAEGVLRRLPPETSVLPCDVLLLDYRLPGLNALEILKEVRQVRRLDIPVVLITGQGSEEIALQAFKLGASDYITKTDNYLYRLPIVLEKVFYHAQLQRQQTALRQSEARYRDLFEEAADGIFIASPEGQYLDVNARGCAMLGYTREEILRKRIADLVPLEDQQVAPLRLDELRAGKTVFSERRMKHKDGHLVHVEISAKKLPDGNLQAIVRDISERKRLEASIQRQRRFEQLVMHLSAHFINLPPEETDAAITRALKLIGEFAGVERSYVFLLDDGGKTASNTHEWCAEGVPPRKDRLQNLPLERLPWWAEKLRRQEPIYIPRLDEMSPEAAVEWEHFREQNIQS
ncbi:MAG: response regulator, partial [Caldilineae bacterium]